MRRTALFAALLFAIPTAAAAAPQCYDGVFVTGYYGVLLSDYDTTTTETIMIGGVPKTYNASFLAETRVKTGGISLSGENLVFWEGEWSIRSELLDVNYFPSEINFVTMASVTTVEDGMLRPFPRAFIDAVALEGSGKIAEGQYLGRPWDGQWHIRSQPLDASGRAVELGVVATDQQFFNATNPLQVTIDPVPPGFGPMFWARDLGPAITDAHIDVFSGWGLEGLQQALNLTSEGNRVCFGI